VKRLSFVAVAVVLLAGCGKRPPPTPDGSSGVRGVCLLPAGDTPGERERWVGLQITAREVNNPDADHERVTRAASDERGEFRIPLNPGEYIIGVHDPELLRNKMLSPLTVRVEPGRFAEVVIDYDKLNVRDLPRR